VARPGEAAEVEKGFWKRLRNGRYTIDDVSGKA
jgi:hypothetical protein